MLNIKFDMQRTGKKLKQLRKAAGYTAEYVSEMVDVSRPATIYEWERGLFVPGIDKLIALCLLFNTKIDDILVYSDEDVAVFMKFFQKYGSTVF